VDRAREHLLAGAALARQQDGRLVLGGALEQLEELDHQRRGGDDRPVADSAAHVALEERVRAPQPFALARLLDREDHLGGLEGLGEVVEGAALQGLDGEVAGAVGGHQQDGCAGEAADQLGQQLEPVHPGHADVAEHDVDGRLEAGEGARRVCGRHRLVAFGREQEREAVAQGRIVVDDQDPVRHQPSERTLSACAPCGVSAALRRSHGCASRVQLAPSNAHAGCVRGRDAHHRFEVTRTTDSGGTPAPCRLKSPPGQADRAGEPRCEAEVDQAVGRGDWCPPTTSSAFASP
jgi:hypothetical protein